jgi:hypothetical protein
VVTEVAAGSFCSAALAGFIDLYAARTCIGVKANSTAHSVRRSCGLAIPRRIVARHQSEPWAAIACS